jgi:molybdopterin molybdotransferase
VAPTAGAPEALSFAEARERVLAAAKPLPPERVELSEARGRSLARAVRATHALPSFRNSSMDGIAVRAADLTDASADSPVVLPVVEVIPAGRPASRPLAAREAMRIMTGAMMPDGADAVVPIEDLAMLDATRVRVGRAIRVDENVRQAGLDIGAGTEALPAGRELSPHDLGLLAALGEAHVAVGRRPQAVVISTGDELLDVGAPLRPGGIRDSNLPMLVALLEECGARVVRANRVADRADAVAAQIRKGLEVADVVLTIGGVSAGDFDPVKESLGQLDGIEPWRVAMKPGRPQAFGAPSGRLFFGLPGNPASVACVFEALVRPALRQLQGFARIDRPRLEVRCAETIPSRAGRTDLVRATLERRDGAWWASPAGDQVSGHVAPQSRAHALLVVPEAAAELAAGDAAEAWLLRWPDEATA